MEDGADGVMCYGAEAYKIFRHFEDLNYIELEIGD